MSTLLTFIFGGCLCWNLGQENNQKAWNSSGNNIPNKKYLLFAFLSQFFRWFWCFSQNAIFSIFFLVVIVLGVTLRLIRTQQYVNKRIYTKNGYISSKGTKFVQFSVKMAITRGIWNFHWIVMFLKEHLYKSRLAFNVFPIFFLL